MSFHARLIQACQREAVPSQLILVSLPAGPDFGVGLKVDDMPASGFFERQIDDAFENPVAFEF